MLMIARSALLGLATLLATLVAVGAVATSPQQPVWMGELLYLPPFVAGMGAAVAHPGPRVGGWWTFIVAVLLAPVLVQGADAGLRLWSGAAAQSWWSYLLYPALALPGALVVQVVRHRVRRRAEQGAVETPQH